MRKKYFLVQAIAITLFVSLCYADSQYEYHTVNVLPKTLTGQANVVSIGKNVRPVGDNAAPVDIDVHEVTLKEASGLNLVEYDCSDPFFTNEELLSQSHKVNMVILPGVNQNAFVIASERGYDNSYKVILGAGIKKITVEQIKNNAVYKSWVMDYPVKPYVVYEITLNFGYESSGGQGGNRVTILEAGTNKFGTNPTWKTIVDSKLYQMGLEQPYGHKLFRFFVGGVRSNVVFQGESVNIIEY